MTVTFSGIPHGDDTSSAADIPSVMTGLTSMTPRINNLSKKPKPVDLDDPVKTGLSLKDLCFDGETISRQKISVMLLFSIFVVSCITVLISIIIAMGGRPEAVRNNAAENLPVGIQFPTVSPTASPSMVPTAIPTLSKLSRPSDVPTDAQSVAPSTKWTFTNSAVNSSKYTILGTENDEEFGYAVAMNGDGTIVAVGARSASSILAPLAGRVEVYELKGDEWVPMGKPIYGRNSQDQFGSSVALSKNGKILVASEPGFDVPNVGRAGNIRSFSWDSSGKEWIPLGPEIRGERAPSLFGQTLSLSGDGIVLAVGAPQETRMYWQDGRVRVYSFQENSWQPYGQPLDGSSSQDWFGSSIDLSESGERIAIGAPHSIKNGGYARVYNMLATPASETIWKLQWIQFGEDIINEIHPVNSKDCFGMKVSLDQDRVAIGSPGKMHNTGFAAVYSYESQWNLLGPPIQGNKLSAMLGKSLCLKGDDLTVGIPNNGGIGEVLFHNYNGQEWVSASPPFSGTSNQEFGHVVVASDNSTRVLAGAPATTHPGSEPGSVSIFSTEAYSEGLGD